MCPHIKHEPLSGRSYCEIIMEFGEAVCEKGKRVACLQSVKDAETSLQASITSWTDATIE